jgi:hypothetical protein
LPDHGVADRDELMSATSQNDYVANEVSLTQVWTIPGTSRSIRLRKGAPGALLVDFAAWFHQHIEPIDTGQLDDWGFAVRPIRGQDVEYDADGNAINLSNHASGTAEDLNATKHPLGKRNTFSAAKTAAIRARLKVYGGAIRWGGDYTGRPDEMHYEIVKSPEFCAQILAALTKSNTPPKDTEDPLMALTDADAAKIGAATAAALAPIIAQQTAAEYAGDQKLVVADNNFDSQRAAYEAVAQAEAAHILAGGSPHTAAELTSAQSAVWSYLRPLWVKP